MWERDTPGSRAAEREGKSVRVCEKDSRIPTGEGGVREIHVSLRGRGGRKKGGGSQKVAYRHLAHGRVRLHHARRHLRPVPRLEAPLVVPPLMRVVRVVGSWLRGGRCRAVGRGAVEERHVVALQCAGLV